MTSVLLVCATELEAQPVLERMPSVTERELPGGVVLHAGHLADVPCDLAITGVGKAAAASGTTAALAVQPGTYALCVSIGLAGAYTGEFIPIGTTVVAAEDVDIDGGALSTSDRIPLASIGLARLPANGTTEAMYDRIETDPSWRDRFAASAGVVPLRFATSDAISADLDTAEARRVASGAAIESMEGHAAGLAAGRFGVPFAEVRAVSNVAGVRDKDAWQIRGPLRKLATVLASTFKAVTL